MSELNKRYLDELKKEHQTIGRLLENIKSFTKTEDIYGMAAHIDALKKEVVSHLEKEDGKLYADLLMVAGGKDIKMVGVTINTFSTAMKSIGDRVLKFFDKYPGKEGTAKCTTEFNKDFQAVYEDILKRVNNEERVLYPMYEKHCC